MRLISLAHMTIKIIFASGVKTFTFVQIQLMHDKG